MPFTPRLVLKPAAFPDAPAFIIVAAETDNWGEPLNFIVLKDADIRGAEYVLRAIAAGRS
ncbi:MAG: hypothetical protein SH850_00805 [Planctomycetaceae bacterium]|nr:hypothetical protein [Planctomycetaceae bacterium]